MSNNKQSSVEWYIIERHNIEIQSRLGEISPIEYDAKLIKIEEQAKAMHKEEMVHFLKWTEGTYSFGNVQGLWYEHINTSRQYTTEELFNKYYNETYGGNK